MILEYLDKKLENRVIELTVFFFKNFESIYKNSKKI